MVGAGDRPAVAALKAAESDSDPSVQDAASEALGMIDAGAAGGRR